MAIDPDERRRRLVELRKGGERSPTRLAKALGCDRATVFRDLALLLEAWMATLRDYDTVLNDELLKLQEVEDEAMDAWHRSIGKKRQVEIGGKEGKKVKVWSDAGDPRLLERVLGVMDRRAKLLGLDKPERHEVLSRVQVVDDADFYGNHAHDAAAEAAAASDPGAAE